MYYCFIYSIFPLHLFGQRSICLSSSFLPRAFYMWVTIPPKSYGPSRGFSS